MYHKYLEYLLDNRPEKTISQLGIRVRRAVNPVVRAVVPLTIRTKLRVVHRAKMPDAPVIFAATHGFREDAEYSLLTARRQAYMLIGSLSQIFRSMDGIKAWVSGTILVDRTDKESRRAAKEKMIYALKSGASILIFPEGAWNISPNLVMNHLFPGVYDVAKETGAYVAPIATHREGKYVYGVLGKAFDITKFNRTEGVRILRDKLGSMRWKLIERYSPAKRDSLPRGKDADAYWRRFVDRLTSEAKYYDYDVEEHTQFVQKHVIHPSEAFAHLKEIRPTRRNAFLFRNHTDEHVPYIPACE